MIPIIKKFIIDRPVVLMVFPLAIFFLFGLNHLTKFETVDEHYWLYSNTVQENYWRMNNGRIEQYWAALSGGNWAKTRINDKPGITLAYVSGIGSFLKTRLENEILTGVHAPMDKVSKAETVNFYFRFPLLLFNGLFCLVLFFLIKRLTGKDWIALLSATLILLSPVIVGISQIINPDSVLWEFAFASILSYLIFLNTGKKRFATLTAIFLGLSLLTKYTSVILLPFFFIVMLFYFVENAKFWKREDLPKKIIRHTAGYILIVLGALAIYAVLLPDNLVNFNHFLKGSVGFKGLHKYFLALFAANLLLLADAYFFKSAAAEWVIRKTEIIEKYLKRAVIVILPAVILLVIVNIVFGHDMLSLFKIPFDSSASYFFAADWYKIVLRQFQPVVFSLAPLVLILAVYAWLRSIAKSADFGWISFVFSLFIVLFMGAVIDEKVPLTIRYSIMLYPLIFTLAGIGLYQIFSMEKRSYFFNVMVFAGTVVAVSVSLWLSKPFYFNYMNSLLPKEYTISDPWGYGGYEAAQYINSLPDSKNMRIWSDQNGVCVFFNGSCAANKLTMNNIQKDSKKSGAGLPKFNYFVSSRRGSMLASGLWDDLKEDYSSEKIYSIEIGDRTGNYLGVYRNK